MTDVLAPPTQDVPRPILRPPRREGATQRTLWSLLDSIARMHPKRIDLRLGRIQRLLAALDNPHHTLPRVIHIAGTNGKGSTLAFLAACLQAHGYSVNGYSSPHLVDFNERIMLRGKAVADAPLIDALHHVLARNQGRAITFFELTTAVAFYLFRATPADVTLVECGMGGRFDATNVFTQPALSVITAIAMDHQRYLGNSLAAIATEKAGIIKANTPCVIAKQKPAIRQLLVTKAQEQQAPALAYGDHWHYKSTPQGDWHYHGKGSYTLPPPALQGGHQYDNAATAVACLEHLLGTSLKEKALCHGISHAVWHARLQEITNNPLNQLLPTGCQLWLDGAHNTAAARALSTSLPLISHGKKWHIILGMLNTKSPKSFIKPLLPLIAQLHTVPVIGDGSQSRQATQLAHALKDDIATHPPYPHESLTAAIQHIAQHVKARANSAPTYILVCGSLYLARDVLSASGRQR
ncbi:MAG: bifunctional folylpolyglutamate synthase/dihydrofolate synthase [Alphaproteobacteria bacterium GM202ARS2]|nr:bifunctional folylpolyglutamate synthase/dihydrofolate synthase [Alphaproteobacteria bacterium GM202ARS2]